jgi:PTH2 family peptidyl-tRNA hydrolase
VLKVATEDQLTAVCAAAASAGLPVDLIRDAGRTQVAPGTPTCLAIGPAVEARIDRVAGSLSLL